MTFVFLTLLGIAVLGWIAAYVFYFMNCWNNYNHWSEELIYKNRKIHRLLEDREKLERKIEDIEKRHARKLVRIKVSGI